MAFEEIIIRKIVTFTEEIRMEGGIQAQIPLRKGIVAAVINNPFAGQFVEDLSYAVDYSAGLGTLLGNTLVKILGGSPEMVESFGKAGIVGVNGEQEHANAFLTGTFGNAFRDTLGGGKAWIPSNSKRGVSGVAIDVPLAFKNALWVRSHYDTVVAQVPDAPGPNEVVIIVAGSTGPRLNARLGGLKKEDVVGEDGLR